MSFCCLDNNIASPEAPLTSPHTCMYILVTEKNRLICKGHLSYTCVFITEFQGRTDPAMKIDIHIFSACARAFPLQVFQDLPIHLQGLHMLYNTLTCTLHPY